MAMAKTVEYSAFNFDTGRYNCTTYLGQTVYQDREELAGAQEIFEQTAPKKWHLIEIRSKCTEETMDKYNQIYPKPPKTITNTDIKGDVANACQVVALNKETNQIITSAWVLRGFGWTAANCARYGLNFCADFVRRYSGFRGSVVAALDAEARRQARRQKTSSRSAVRSSTR